MRAVEKAPGEETVDRPRTRRSYTNGAPREHRTVIRHSDEEWARVTAMAVHLGLSVPGFYERAAFAGSAQAAVELSGIYDALHGVRRGLGLAHNNLNQIAHTFNTVAMVMRSDARIEDDLIADLDDAVHTLLPSVLADYADLLPRLAALLGPVEDKSPKKSWE